MTPGARILALHEIIETFFFTLKPMDQIIQRYFASRRYAGSKDRAFIVDHAFNLFRQWEEINKGKDLTPRHAIITYLKIKEGWIKEDFDTHFKGGKYTLEPLNQEESIFNEKYPYEEWQQANVPQFLWPEFQKSFGDRARVNAQALQSPATVDLRVNTLKSDREKILEEFKRLSLSADATPYSPWGIRLKQRLNLEGLDVYKKGQVEIQDEGSQLLSLFCAPQPGQNVLDLCAGAGGKTLTMAAMMENKGQITATDIEIKRLKRIRPRLLRAGVTNVKCESWPLKEDLKFDLVLIDVPCSGTGTWRRSPDLRARFKVNTYEKILKIQQDLLWKAATHVNRGGRLVYATCSLLSSENDQQIKAFLAHHAHFQKKREMYITPLIHQTDGFYGVELLRIS